MAQRDFSREGLEEEGPGRRREPAWGVPPPVYRPDDTQPPAPEKDRPTGARIMVVDDDDVVRRVIHRTLAVFGYECAEAASAFEAMDLIGEFHPHVTLSDVHMEEMDGMELLGFLRDFDPDVQVILLTGKPDLGAAVRAMKSGASDYLSKPVEADRLVQAIESALEKRRMARQLREYQNNLERLVSERTRALSLAMEELRENHDLLLGAYHETLDRLVRVSRWRDNDTGNHIRRIGLFAGKIAQKAGLASEHAKLIENAAPLHDLGKIGIPDSILLKRGKLTREEFDIIKYHTVIGAHILGGGKSRLVQESETIALTHHERWDGKGYPRGLQGDAIPIAGRIVAIVDVFDALIHERPYKAAYSVEEALDIMREGRGTQFDPGLFDLFLPLARELRMEGERYDSETPFAGEDLLPELEGAHPDWLSLTALQRLVESRTPRP